MIFKTTVLLYWRDPPPQFAWGGPILYNQYSRVGFFPRKLTPQSDFLGESLPWGRFSGWKDLRGGTLHNKTGTYLLLPIDNSNEQYEVPHSRMLHDILYDDDIQRHPPLIWHNTNFDPVTDLDLITDFDFLPNCESGEVSVEHLRRVRHANRGRPLLWTTGPVHFWTCICSTCWDQRHSISIRYYSSLWHYDLT